MVCNAVREGGRVENCITKIYKIKWRMLKKTSKLCTSSNCIVQTFHLGGGAWVEATAEDVYDW